MSECFWPCGVHCDGRHAGIQWWFAEDTGNPLLTHKNAEQSHKNVFVESHNESIAGHSHHNHRRHSGCW